MPFDANKIKRRCERVIFFYPIGMVLQRFGVAQTLSGRDSTKSISTRAASA